MRPTVSLCMIVRNEEKNLAECLRGVAGVVDEIIVVDTGSTDRTKAEAERLGAKVFDFPWIDDFAAARNESLRHATGDWVLWLDADDRIDATNLQRLGAVIDNLGGVDASGNPVYLMATLFPMAGHAADVRLDHVRLFPRNGRISWRGIVHEILSDTSGDGRSLSGTTTDVAIRHEGYIDPEQHARKVRRDLRLLEKAFLLEPNNPTVAFYLGRTHATLNNFELAVQFLRRAIRLDVTGEFLCTGQAYVICMVNLQRLGRTEEALALGAEGVRRFPTNIEILFNYSQQLFHNRRYAECEQHLRQLLSMPSDSPRLAPMLESLSSDYSWLLLGDSVAQQGRWMEAAQFYRNAAERQPASADAWFNIGQAGIALGRRDLLEEALMHLERLPHGVLQASLAQSQLCVLDGRWDEGLAWVEQALRLQPGYVYAHVLLSDVLYQQGKDLPRCIAVHRRALELDPSQTILRQRLAELETRLNVTRRASTGSFAGGSLAAAAQGNGGLAFVA